MGECNVLNHPHSGGLRNRLIKTLRVGEIDLLDISLQFARWALIGLNFFQPTVRFGA